MKGYQCGLLLIILSVDRVCVSLPVLHQLNTTFKHMDQPSSSFTMKLINLGIQSQMACGIKQPSFFNIWILYLLFGPQMKGCNRGQILIILSVDLVCKLTYVGPVEHHYSPYGPKLTIFYNDFDKFEYTDTYRMCAKSTFLL